MRTRKIEQNWKHLLLKPLFLREFKNEFRLSIYPFPLVGCSLRLQRGRAGYPHADPRAKTGAPLF